MYHLNLKYQKYLLNRSNLKYLLYLMNLNHHLYLKYLMILKCHLLHFDLRVLLYLRFLMSH